MELNTEQILKILPHQYPMLLIDRVVSLTPGKQGTAIKAVTFNEPFFEGHLPAHPILPAVYQIEMCAQLINLIYLSIPGNEKKDLWYAKISKAKFHRRVYPGCILHIYANKKAESERLAIFETMLKVSEYCMVGGEEDLVFSGEIAMQLPEDLRSGI